MKSVTCKVKNVVVSICVVAMCVVESRGSASLKGLPFGLPEGAGGADSSSQLLEPMQGLCDENNKIIFESFEEIALLLGREYMSSSTGHKEGTSYRDQNRETIKDELMRPLLKGLGASRTLSAALAIYQSCVNDLVRKNEALEQETEERLMTEEEDLC